MTDENKRTPFKAPPMPTGKIQVPTHKPSEQHFTRVSTGAAEQKQVEGTPVNENASATNQEAVENPYANNFAAELNLPPKILQTKVMGSILIGIFFFGIMMGCAMSGGNGKQVVQGLEDVVINPQVKANPKVRRCGRTDPNRECVLYIMNSKNYDRLAEDFFQEAQDITGVQKYSIQLSNTRYANSLIQPGWIAQIYIPARH